LQLADRFSEYEDPRGFVFTPVLLALDSDGADWPTFWRKS
jgi:hypothetical protein